MPEVKISALPPASSANPSDVVAIVQDGVTKKLPISAILGSEADNSVSHLKALPVAPISGVAYSVIGFYSGATVGGGLFVFKPDVNKASHNGVTVYATEALAAWDGTQSDIATLLNWTGVGSGVWVRILNGFVTPEMAGAVGDGFSNDHVSMQAAFNNSLGCVVLRGVIYRINQITPLNDMKIFGVPEVTRLKVNDGAPSSTSCVALPLNDATNSLKNFYCFGVIFDSNKKEAGFLINGGENLLFESCSFTNNQTYWFAAQVRPGEEHYAVKDNIVFNDCKFNDNGIDPSPWDGVDIKYGTNIRFFNCSANNNTHTGFDVRGQVEYVNCSTRGNGIIGFHAQTDNSAADSPTIVSMTNCSSNGDENGFRFSASSLNQCTVMGNVSAINSATDGVYFAAPVGGGSNGIKGLISVFVTGCVNGINVANNSVESLSISGISYSNTNHGMSNDGQNVVIDMIFKGNMANGYRELSNSSNNLLLPTCVFKWNASGDIPTRIGNLTDKTAISYVNELNVRVFPHLDGSINFERVSNVLARIGAVGATGNIDLELSPKGTGKVRYGTHIASVDTAITGYIEIKDSSGAIRKLAVIS